MSAGAGTLSHTPADRHAQVTPTWNHTVSAWTDLPHHSAKAQGSAGAAGARQGRGGPQSRSRSRPQAPDLRPRYLAFLVAVLGPPFLGADGAKTLPVSAGGHSPESSHHLNGVTCTLLFPPVQRRARCQAGRRAERGACPPGGRTSPHFCSPACKGPSMSSVFPSVAALPGAGPRQDKPSALLAATDTKARAKKPKDAPRLSSERW